MLPGGRWESSLSSPAGVTDTIELPRISPAMGWWFGWMLEWER